MIKQREIIFHIEENEQSINVKTKIEPKDAIIILGTLLRFLGEKGLIGPEKTKKEIEA